MKAILNGKIIEEKDAVIPISDKGYFYDFAVYSSLKVIQGKIFFPDFHVERLFDSAKKIGLTHPFTKPQVLKWLQMVISKNAISDGLLRVILIGDADASGDRTENVKLFIFAVTGVTFYPEKLYTNGAKVITFTSERHLPTVKSKDLLISFMAMRQAKQADAIEALLVDKDGNIREGTRSNFYAVRGSTIILPPQEKVLQGVVQKIILDLANGHFELSYEDIPFSKISDYTEFFLTSTLFNIMPISQIDDYKITTDFPITRQLIKLYKEYYRKNILKK